MGYHTSKHLKCECLLRPELRTFIHPNIITSSPVKQFLPPRAAPCQNSAHSLILDDVNFAIVANWKRSSEQREKRGGSMSGVCALAAASTGCSRPTNPCGIRMRCNIISAEPKRNQRYQVFKFGDLRHCTTTCASRHVVPSDVWRH